MEKKKNRERVSSKTHPINSSEVLRELFQDLADVYSGKFNPTKDERGNI